MGRPRKHPKKEPSVKASSTVIAVERAYTYLRHQAITFGIRPNERINEVEVAAFLDMSRAPVREALNRLVMNDLMMFEPGKGFFCRKLSVKEVSDLYAVRADLEISGVRAACLHASDEDIAAMKESWDQIAACQTEMDIEALVDCDEKFHMDLASLSGNAERVKFVKNINDRIRFVRRINLEAEGRRAVIIDDHSRILSAIADRNMDKALEMTSVHLNFRPEDLKSSVHEGIARIYADEMA